MWQLLMGQQGWNPSKHRLLCTAKNPLGNGAKGRAEPAPTPSLHWAMEPESTRAGVVPWRCQSSGQELSPEGSGSPDKGQCSVLQRKSSNPRGPRWGHPRSLESCLSLNAWHEGHLHGAGAADRWPQQPKGAQARGCAQCCRGRQKNPGTLASSPWGKKSLPAPSCRARRAIFVAPFVMHDQQALTQPE